MQELIGKTLGDRYKLTAPLGSGAMGDVYLAEHVILGKKMAVKVLKPDFCKNAELVRRFEQEAIAASRIGHDNIVDVTDFGRTQDGALYFVMEVLEGEDLSTLIQKHGPMPLPRALAILMQICRALAAAHARGIVHRDLKLENVMLVPREDGSELVKILDFGISKVSTVDGDDARRLTKVGTLMGTPDYMAPEVIKGEPVDHRADIYSFGILAFELVTGQVPFDAPTATGVLVKHVNEQPRPPSFLKPELPPSFDHIVLRALEKEPAHRFQSMEELKAALAAVHVGAGALSMVTPPPRRLTPMGTARTLVTGAHALEKDVAQLRKAQRRWPLFLVLGLVFVSASAFGVWRAMHNEPTEPPAPAPQPPPAPAPVAVAPTPAPAPTPPAPVPAPAPVVAPAPVPAKAAPPPLARLTGKEIGAVFVRSQGKLRRCLQDHRAQLPSNKGALDLTFTILDSGAVSKASVKPDALDANISQCVVGRLKELRFPRNLERETTFELPLAYEFKD